MKVGAYGSTMQTTMHLAPPSGLAVFLTAAWVLAVDLESALPSTRSGALQKFKGGHLTAFRLTVADAVSARQGKQLYIDLRSAGFFNVGERTCLLFGWGE